MKKRIHSLVRTLAPSRWVAAIRHSPKGIRRVILGGAGLALTGIVGLAGLCLAVAFVPFPSARLETWGVSPRVYDHQGRLLAQRVGSDGQWRFPVPMREMSPWLPMAALAIEDERFWKHSGVDPVAAVRAAGQNAAAGRIVSGASTITMQLCRMMNERTGPQRRSLGAKLGESFRALQLERRRTKPEILELYLNCAPCGGNILGAEAAAWFYFGKRAHDLSLAEAALLAGLPQSPTRFRPDLHPEAAKARRGQVLRRMTELGMIAADQARAAEAEPVRAARPGGEGRPTAPHAAQWAISRRPAGGTTTIDLDLQLALEREAAERAKELPTAADLAAIVIEIETGEIRALVGSADARDPADGLVNGVLAARSPGSALKPFIYAAAFETKRFDPGTVISDVPINRRGWTPRNFTEEFTGSASMADALRRSLNIPAILVAEQTGLARCLGTLESAGIHLPPLAMQRGGLALAVGAIETTLLDLTNGYATLGRGGVAMPPRLFPDEAAPTHRALAANACAAVDDILSIRKRGAHGLGARDPEGLPWFMWKTGTSAGRRDAWAVGHNGRYAIGVWVGKFSGTPHMDFVGARAAEPLLAALFTAPPFARTAEDPAAAQEWMARRPMDPATHRPTGGPRITSPVSGSVFLAADAGAVLHPKAAGADTLQWFLNGKLLPEGTEERLILGKGSYELRCANAQGQASAVKFRVR